MDERHTPNTQKVKYMLSELNDHYNLWERFHESGSNEYISITIWFGGLRNKLTTNIDYNGDILMGEIKCIAEKDIKKEDIKPVIPDICEIQSITNNQKNTNIRIIIHSSRNARSMNPNEYVGIVKSLKESLLDQEYIQNQ
jgi:hypothetical protein